MCHGAPLPVPQTIQSRSAYQHSVLGEHNIQCSSHQSQKRCLVNRRVWEDAHEIIYNCEEERHETRILWLGKAWLPMFLH